MRLMKLLRLGLQLKQGDFSRVAVAYARFQPAYAPTVVQALLGYVRADTPGFVAADIGAGTGKWSRQLLEAGVRCVCVEPTAQMRQLGAQATDAHEVVWVDGSGENTTLPTASVDWITVAAAFHWMDHAVTLREFDRILKPNGYLTLLRHPLAPKQNATVTAVSSLIDAHLPPQNSRHKARHQAGIAALRDYASFGDLLYMQAQYEHTILVADYLEALSRVPDSTELVQKLRALLADTDNLHIAYSSQTWTVQKQK